MPDLSLSEEEFIIEFGGRIIHTAECARNQWKAGNPYAALIYWDRVDALMGRVFKRLMKEDPELARKLMEAAANANEGK